MSRSMDIFPYLRMDGVDYGIAELEAPWAGRVEESRCHYLYVLREGRCVFESSGEGRSFPVGVGDIVAVTNNVPHVLRDSTATLLPKSPRPLPVRLLSERPCAAAAPAGGGRAARRTLLFVGRVPCDVDPMIRLLPTVIHIPLGSSTHGDRIAHLIELVTAEVEAAELEPGWDSVIRRLSEIMVIELVRFIGEALRDGNPVWTRGLADPEIARTIARLHAEPGHAWTLRELCRIAGLSRAALEARFRRLVDESPKRYLLKLRMQRAAIELEQGFRSVAEIADSLGYASVASFHRAFKREFDVTPADHRRGGTRAERAAV